MKITLEEYGKSKGKAIRKYRVMEKLFHLSIIRSSAAFAASDI
jgi:hypothetical protein